MGLYEYSAKDFTNYFKNSFTTYGSINDIKKILKKYKRVKEKNEYTGIFKNKNVIMIMMESIDYMAIDKKSMPTLYKMMNEGWKFPDRYSALSTGGSTILTEYTSMSGLLYNYQYMNQIMNNNYSTSLPNLFNNSGYTTSFFHENNGKYYNREKLHTALGFKNRYFLYDMFNRLGYNCGEDIKLDTAYAYCDSQFANNGKVYNKIINKKKKFMSFIVTISAHGPYDSSNAICGDLNDDQIECIKRLSKRTDDMLAALLNNLKRDELLDDTVIILYTDHQAYSLNYPDEYLDGLKEIDQSKNIKAIPLIIYNQSLTKKSFDELYVNDYDLVPTISNMFDLDYNPNEYIGTDIFSKQRKNMLVFFDRTWFENGIYSQNTNADTSSNEYKSNSVYAKDIVDLSKMIISNNYYKTVSNQ